LPRGYLLISTSYNPYRGTQQGLFKASHFKCKEQITYFPFSFHEQNNKSLMINQEIYPVPRYPNYNYEKILYYDKDSKRLLYRYSYDTSTEEEIKEDHVETGYFLYKDHSFTFQKSEVSVFNYDE